MYTIKLNEDAFNSGGKFFGMQPNRVMLVIGDTFDYTAIPQANKDVNNYISYSGFNIGVAGTDIEDNIFERLQHNILFQLCDYISKDLVTVIKDGAEVTEDDIWDNWKYNV